MLKDELPVWPLPANAYQHDKLIAWSHTKAAEVATIDETTASVDSRFNLASSLPRLLQPVAAPTADQIGTVRDTVELYFRLFGRNSISSFVWTGVETANPLTKDETYRWNSLQDAGFYDPVRRAQIIDRVKSFGIRSIRLGMPNHEIDLNNAASWAKTTEIIDALSSAGMNISLDLHHFGIEDQFKTVGSGGQSTGETSYYLNPAWPDYFAEFSLQAYMRYHDKIKAITLINEPETTAGFNSNFWHGGYPGWSAPISLSVELERYIILGIASVKARSKIEAYRLTLPDPDKARLPFIHSEAVVYKPYWPDYNRWMRFLTADFMLGHPWIFEADLDAVAAAPLDTLQKEWGTLADADKTSLKWLTSSYVFYNQDPKDFAARRTRLITLLKALRQAHLDFQSQFHITMRTDAVFGADYYMQNEDKGTDGKALSSEPQYYAEQVKAGNRVGLYPALLDYWTRYQIPLMVAESGTSYYFYGPKWHEQMLLEAAAAAESGAPFLGYTIYPVIDTYGWEAALAIPRSAAVLNPSGILNTDLTPKYFIGRTLDSLKSSFDP